MNEYTTISVKKKVVKALRLVEKAEKRLDPKMNEVPYSLSKDIITALNEYFKNLKECDDYMEIVK